MPSHRTTPDDTTPSHTEVSMKKSRRILTPKTLFLGLAGELDLLGAVYAKLREVLLAQIRRAHPVLSPKEWTREYRRLRRRLRGALDRAGRAHGGVTR